MVLLRTVEELPAGPGDPGVEHIVPSARKAAADAGRSEPRVVAGLAVCLTDDADETRGRFGARFAMAGQVPEYRAMLEREGVESPAELLIAGSEVEVAQAITRLASTGITDLMLAPFGTPDEQNRTTASLRSADLVEVGFDPGAEAG